MLYSVHNKNLSDGNLLLYRHLMSLVVLFIGLKTTILKVDNTFNLFIMLRKTYKMTTTTQTAKVANALVNGAQLTAKQITSRYGVKSVSSLISKLRSEGLSIYLNKRVSSFDGESYMKYMIGTPTRAVVAAGYKALRSA
jgi:hypothetical protein